MKAEFNLTGGKAFVAMAVILGVVGFGWVKKSRTLQTQAVEVIEIHLAAEYSRHMFPVLEKAAQIPGVDQREIDRLTKNFSPEGIDIVSLRARGRGSDVVAKVEIEVDGALPPDAKRVRYYRLKHSTLTGWSVKREVSMWSYYSAF